jgi:hypothetical protein
MGLILTKHTSPVGCRGPDLWAQAVLPGGSSIRSSTTSDSSTFARPPSTRVLPQNPSGPRARHGVAKRDDGQLHHNGHDNRRRRRRAREQALQWRGFHHLRWQGAAAGGGRDDRPGPSTGEAAAEAPAPVRESLPRRSPLRSHVSLLLLAFRGSGFGGDWFVAVWRVDWLTSELAWVFFLRYEKSYMHRDVVTHVAVSPADFFITGSADGDLSNTLVSLFRGFILLVLDGLVSASCHLCSYIFLIRKLHMFSKLMMLC